MTLKKRFFFHSDTLSYAIFFVELFFVMNFRQPNRIRIALVRSARYGKRYLGNAWIIHRDAAESLHGRLAQFQFNSFLLLVKVKKFSSKYLMYFLYQKWHKD